MSSGLEGRFCCPGDHKHLYIQLKEVRSVVQLSVSSTIWKSAIPYLQSSDSSECSFHLATPPISTHSQQTEMIVVLIGEEAHISLVPGLCLAWVHFTFLNSTFIVTGSQCGNYYHCFSMEETECQRSLENHALSYSSINGRVRI